MASKEGRSSSASSVLFTSGVATLLATSCALFASGITVHHWTRPVSIAIDTGAISSLKNAEIRLALGDLASADEIKLPEVQLAFDLHAKLPPAHRIRSVKGAPVMIAADTVVVSAAAPEIEAPKTAAPVISTELDEAAKMRTLHLLLQQRFTAALHIERTPIALNPIVSTQVAEAAPRPRPLHKKERNTRAITQSIEKQEIRVSIPQAEKPVQMKLAQLDTLAGQGILSDAPAPLSFQPLIQQASLQAEKTLALAQRIGEAAPERNLASSKTSQPLDDNEPGISFQGISAHQNIAAANTAMTTQPTGPAALSPATHDYPPANSGLTTHESPRGIVNALDGSRQYVEAFDWDKQVAMTSHSSLTDEGAGYGWISYSAQDHLPTLTRKSVSTIPFITENTAQLLAYKQGARLQGETGIVFGKIPDGWTVEFSGRAEKPLFFNSDTKPISWAVFEGERYFVFVNAAPGAHLIHVIGRPGESTGAVAILVQSGAATYLDLTSIKRKSLSGYVLNGSSAEAEPLSRVQVRVLGRSGDSIATDADGHFEIDNVVTVSDHLVLIETEGLAGFTHRYQLRPNKLRGIQLFRFDEYQINTWISQLEGGISPESGLIVAAPSIDLLNAQPAEEKILPKVSTLVQNPNLNPETYTVSPDGQLEVKKALDRSRPRLVSVQVPEGPSLVEIGEENQPALWSQLVFSSPGVVNLVSP